MNPASIVEKKEKEREVPTVKKISRLPERINDRAD